MSHTTPASVVVDHSGGKAHIRHLAASTYLRPRALGCRGNRIKVALVGACATLLAGDEVAVDIDVGADTYLELVEPSGTVAYHARGGAASWTASIRVAEGGCLVWAGAPFVVAHGADVQRHTDLNLSDAAAILLRETLVLGRSGEAGGRLRATLAASQGGRPLLVEDLDLRNTHLRSAPAMLEDGRVVATATLLGIAPHQLAEPHETLLASPGALRREITTHAHLAEEVLGPTWMRWRRLIEDTSSTVSNPADR